MPDGLSLVTKGIIIGKNIDFTTIRIYCPFKIDINERRPTIVVRPIKKQISLDIECRDN